MSDDTSRLAVLIDADNISPKVAKDVFEELAGYGTLTVKRAYGDWTTSQLNGWKEQLHSYAIAPMQQFAYTVGKNSTDSALIIDAMDLLYAGHLDGFVLVSSDSDFTRLATRLRESGMTVYGLGAKKTPRAFRDACDKFTFLEVLRTEQAEGQGTPDSTVQDETREETPGRSREASAPNLQSMLTKALNKTATDDDWSALGSLGSHLNRTDPSFDPRTHGFAKLSDLVKAQPFLETKTVESSGRGQLWVRLKRRAATKKSSRAPAKKATGGSEKAPTAKAADVAGQAADNTPDNTPGDAPVKKSAPRRTTRKVTQTTAGGV